MLALLLTSFVIGSVSAVPIAGPLTSSHNGTGYSSFCVGSCSSPGPKVSSTPALLLMGGGTDVDDAFSELVPHAAGGDFVVLRSTGTDAYNQYIYDLAKKAGSPLRSVTTFIITSRAGAQQEYVRNWLENAGGVFMAGGDQYDYLSFWRDTPVSDALQRMSENGALGGTSAGLAVLGEFQFSAEEGGEDSEHALENPYDSYLTLSRNFLNVSALKNTITDTHFYQRDRMGRLVTFMARLIQDGWSDSHVRGIACDEQTAIVVVNGTGRVYNQDIGADHVAYLVEATRAPSRCERREPLDFDAIHAVRAPHNAVVDLTTFKGISGTSEYDFDARDGRLPRDVYDGRDSKTKK